MASHTLTLAVWYLRLVWRRSGWQLFVAALLILIGVVCLWQRNVISHRHEKLRADLAQLRAKPTPIVESAGRDSTAQSLMTFYARLPEQAAIPSLVQEIFSVARRHGLTILRGNYRPLVDTTTNMVRYEVTLPVRGEAQQIERFVLAALNGSPSLALIGVSLKREGAHQSEIEAQLRFELEARIQ